MDENIATLTAVLLLDYCNTGTAQQFHEAEDKCTV
jgi:hypothetical protein